MIRLFVGLELDRDQKAALLGLMHGVSGVKWQRDDQLHLTLSFIGEVPRNIARDIADALAAIDFSPFELSLAGVGLFGSLDKPRLLWAGVKEADPLHHLHDKIERVLTNLCVGLACRKYKPHVTLTRVRKRIRPFDVEQWMAVNDNFSASPTRVESFTLFSSQLSHNGSYYHSEAIFPAQGVLIPEFAEDILNTPDIAAVKEAYVHK